MLTKPHQQELQRELESIRELLASSDSLDPKSTTALKNLVADMEQRIDDANVDNFSRCHQLWQDAVLDFEAHHPEMTVALAAVTGILANAGI